VLGGGGIAGYSFHAGALAALHAAGWDARTADVIVGTSAGSSVGAVLRGDVSPTALVERILTVPTDSEGMDRLRRISGRGETRLTGTLLNGELPLPASIGLVLKELFKAHRMRPLNVMAGALPPGRLATDVLGEQAAVLHPDGWPERELWIPAVDLDSGELTVFGRDDRTTTVATAVEASCAIPGFFRPVRVGNRFFVDGGVRSLMNSDLLLDREVDLVVALSPMSLDRVSPRSPVATWLRGFPSGQLRYEMAKLRQAGIPALVLEPDRTVSRSMGPNPMDPTRMVPVLIASAFAINERLDHPDLVDKLELLRAAAAVIPLPPDVPYPD
jgi:NTE family protein